MSEVKRVKMAVGAFSYIQEADDGKWVVGPYTDYAALLRRCEEAKSRLAEAQKAAEAWKQAAKMARFDSRIGRAAEKALPRPAAPDGSALREAAIWFRDRCLPHTETDDWVKHSAALSTPTAAGEAAEAWMRERTVDNMQLWINRALKAEDELAALAAAKAPAPEANYGWANRHAAAVLSSMHADFEKERREQAKAPAPAPDGWLKWKKFGPDHDVAKLGPLQVWMSRSGKMRLSIDENTFPEDPTKEKIERWLFDSMALAALAAYRQHQGEGLKHECTNCGPHDSAHKETNKVRALKLKPTAPAKDVCPECGRGIFLHVCTQEHRWLSESPTCHGTGKRDGESNE